MARRPFGGSETRLLWIVLGSSTVLRLLLAALVPLHYDEALYWVWSRHPALGYPEQPPLVAYLIFLGTRLGDAALWMRLPAVLIGVATSYALFLFARDLFGQSAGLLAALLAQFLPYLFMGGVSIVPDTPQLLAWILALRFFWQAVNGQPRRWTAAGAALGLGLLSKLFTGVLGVGIVLYMTLQERPWLRRPEPYRALLVTLALFAPVIVWNARHDWAGLRFLLEDRTRMLAPPTGWRGIEMLVAPQFYGALLLFPALVWAAVVAWRRRADRRFAYLLYTIVPAVLFAAVIAPRGLAQGHWMAPVYLPLVLVLSAQWNRVLAWITAGNGLLMVVLLALLLVPGLPAAPGTENLYGFDEVTEGVRRELAGLGPGAVFVTDRYPLAAVVTYYGRGEVPVVLVPYTGAPYWASPRDFAGADGFGLTYPLGRFDVRRCFERAEERPRQARTYRGRVVLAYRAFRLHGLSALCVMTYPRAIRLLKAV